MLNINSVVNKLHTPRDIDINKTVAAWDNDSYCLMRGFLKYIKTTSKGFVYGIQYDNGNCCVVEYQNASVLNEEDCRRVICKDGVGYVLGLYYEDESKVITTLGIYDPTELYDFDWEKIKNAIA